DSAEGADVGEGHGDTVRRGTDNRRRRQDFLVVRFAVVFLVVLFFAVPFFVVVFLAPRLLVFFAGPRSRRSASRAAARSRVRVSTESSLRRVALYSPSVT